MKELFLHLMLLFCLLVLGACTAVELCDEPEHPHRTGVRFNYDWSNTRNGKLAHEEPDSMYIIAKRIVGSWKCEVKVNSQDGSGWYVWNAPDRRITTYEEPDETEENNDSTITAEVDTTGIEEDASEPKTHTVEVEEELPGVDMATDEFQLRPGTFKFVTFNRDTTELIYREVDSYVRAAETDTTLRDLNVEYKRYAYSDPKLRGTVDYWKDYNTYGDNKNYIQPDITPIYYDTIAPCDIKKNAAEQFTFKPHLLSQNIDIRFHIRKKVDVEPFIIDSIYADIAGIPYKVNLSNDFIDISTTCKMMFQAHLENENGSQVQDTETNTYLLCHGNIDVLSIVNAPDSIVGRGPGIMQVMVFIHDRQPIRGKINLYHTIYRANLYDITEDGLYARRRKEYGVLEIDSNLVIDENFIISSDDDGLERWQAADEGDIVIDV